MRKQKNSFFSVSETQSFTAYYELKDTNKIIYVVDNLHEKYKPIKSGEYWKHVTSYNGTPLDFIDSIFKYMGYLSIPELRKGITPIPDLFVYDNGINHFIEVIIQTKGTFGADVFNSRTVTFNFDNFFKTSIEFDSDNKYAGTMIYLTLYDNLLNIATFLQNEDTYTEFFNSRQEDSIICGNKTYPEEPIPELESFNNQ